MTPSWYISPLGRAHFLDADRSALCGNYTPEAVDLRPAPLDSLTCHSCLRIVRPETVVTGKGKTLAPKVDRTARLGVLQERILEMRRQHPEMLLTVIAHRTGASRPHVLNVIRRAERNAAEVTP